MLGVGQVQFLLGAGGVRLKRDSRGGGIDVLAGE